MSVTVDVSDESLKLVTDDATIGVWSLKEIKVDPRSDGFHIKIDGEEAILNVNEALRFASELKLSAPVVTTVQRRKVAAASVSAPSQDPIAAGEAPQTNLINQRISGPSQEEQLADMRRQVNDLREAMSNPSIPPAVVFGRWLALLKLMNRRHGQGAMPTPLFFRLNTELLDMMPAPETADPKAFDTKVAS